PWKKMEITYNLEALVPKEATNVAASKTWVNGDSVIKVTTDGPTYNRRQVSKMLGVSQTSILRWEKKGKVPQPYKLAHSGQCVYTDENVEILRKYMTQTYVAPAPQLTDEQKKDRSIKTFSKK